MAVLGFMTVFVCVLVAVLAGKEPTVDPGLLTWRAVARQLGLWCEGSRNERIIAGTLDGIPVRVDFRRSSSPDDNSETVTFQAAGDGQVPRSLDLRKDSSLRAMRRVLDGRDHALGDEAFDDLVELPNLDASVCAALSSEARRQLTPLLEQGGEIQSGRLVFTASTRPAEEGPWLVQMLKFLAQLSTELSVPPSSLPDRLARNATSDSSAAVRLRNLLFLIEPSTRAPLPTLRAACRVAMTDEHASVRLVAARQLGADGRAVLRELTVDVHVDADVRAAALRALHEQGAEVDELVSTLLASSQTAVVCAALDIASAQWLSGCSDAVLARAQSGDESVVLHAARALGVLAPPGAEQSLLRLLSHASREVRLASMEALGEIGGAPALEALTRLAEGFGRSQLRESARSVIARIQSRLSHPSAGGLSLVVDRELDGALAVSEPFEAGELALVDGERGKLASSSE